MRKLVVLRPEPGASDSIERARAAGLEAVAVPLFEVVPVTWAAPVEHFDAVLLTSANAARFGGAKLGELATLPAYCVGEATAAAARSAGFTVAAVGAGDAEALSAIVPDGLRLLHLAGRDHRAIAGATSIIVYDSRPIAPPPSLAVLNGNVAMVHSARAGARLAELVSERQSIAIAAISSRAAEACGSGWERIVVSREADDRALLALAADLCQKLEG